MLFQADPAKISVSGKEIAVLWAIASLKNAACCGDLQGEILNHTGKEPRLATLYALLTGLERKGLIEPFVSNQHENGGRPRHVYRVTEAGRRAIALGEAMAERQGALLAPA